MYCLLTLNIHNKLALNEDFWFLGHLSGKDGRIKATTNSGSVTVKSLDWMESLRLKGFDMQWLKSWGPFKSLCSCNSYVV